MFNTFSQEEQYPLDKWLDSCIENDSTTAGMTNCTVQAYKKWDVELNKYYQLLKSKCI